MPLPEEVEGGGGGGDYLLNLSPVQPPPEALLHFSPVLPPLMAPPELRKGSSIHVFLVLTVIKRGESSLAVINRFLQSSIFS